MDFFKKIKELLRSNKKYFVVSCTIIITFWGIFIVFIILMSFNVFGKLPSIEQIQDPEKSYATEIISSDNIVIGKYYKENRSPAKYHEISDTLIKALIATEDERFFDHSGIDIFSLFRAVAFLGTKGGASTITQQLAKMYFTENPSRNIFSRTLQKFKEWIIAVKLEREYTKEEIIEQYLNKFDFLYLAVGINSASKIYFNKSAKDLSVEESAVLVGMAKNPSLYNPIRFPINAINRRNTVYMRMYKNNILTKDKLLELSSKPISLNFTPESHNQGLATYFREHLRSELKVWIRNNPKSDGSFYSLETDGLKIYTTIDSRMQEYAEASLQEHLRTLQKVFNRVTYSMHPKIYPFVSKEEDSLVMNPTIRNLNIYKVLSNRGKSHQEITKYLSSNDHKMTVYTLEKGYVDTILTTIDSIRHIKSLFNASLISVEPQTGYVKAWVGGYDYREFKYDNVFQMRRQVGSTFKPFVYGTAIDQLKMSPCDKISNTNVVFTKEKWGVPEDWSPRNANSTIDGRLYTLTKALANSINTITAKILEKIGSTAPIINFARRIGIESNIPSSPAMCLGTSDVSLYEMAGAYATFVNKGIHIKPTYLLKIEDKNGTVLANFNPEIQEAISEESAYVITKLLEGVINYGSGVRLKTTSGNYEVFSKEDNTNFCTGYPYGFTNSIAGKTGTTQNQSDGWFIGMVPNLVTGVWVGHDTRNVHFEDLYYGQGASTALPIWALFMKKCYQDNTLKVSKDSFAPPKNPISIQLDCSQVDMESIIKLKNNIEDEDF